MKVLLFGVIGFIGKVVFLELLEKGYNVIVLVRLK